MGRKLFRSLFHILNFSYSGVFVSRFSTLFTKTEMNNEWNVKTLILVFVFFFFRKNFWKVLSPTKQRITFSHIHPNILFIWRVASQAKIKKNLKKGKRRRRMMASMRTRKQTHTRIRIFLFMVAITPIITAFNNALVLWDHFLVSLNDASVKYLVQPIYHRPGYLGKEITSLGKFDFNFLSLSWSLFCWEKPNGTF